MKVVSKKKHLKKIGKLEERIAELEASLANHREYSSTVWEYFSVRGERFDIEAKRPIPIPLAETMVMDVVKTFAKDREAALLMGRRSDAETYRTPVGIMSWKPTHLNHPKLNLLFLLLLLHRLDRHPPYDKGSEEDDKE